MILYLLVILAVVLTAIAYLYAKETSTCYTNDFIEVVTILVSSVLDACAIIALIVVLIINVGSEAKIAAAQERYNSLVYQLEQKEFESGNTVAKKELYKEIQDWNEDLAFNKKAQHDFWIGPFYADWYDELDFIRLDNPITTE